MKKSKVVARTPVSPPKQSWPSTSAASSALAKSKPVQKITWTTVVGGIAAALIFGFILYGSALNGPFLFDDRYLPFLNLGLLSKPLSAWFIGLRPLVTLSFWLNAQISGADTWSYHAGNIILHAFNSVLVFFIARWFLEQVSVPSDRRTWLAVFSGAFFLAHPLQTEAVAYITSRSETLAVFFFYSALALFLYRRRTGLTWLWTLVILALFAGSQLTKEYAAVFVFLPLLTDWLFPLRVDAHQTLTAAATMKRNWRLYALLLVGIAIGGAVIVPVLMTATSAGFHLKQVGPIGYFFTQCRAIWRYLRLVVFPFGQNVDPEFPFSPAVGDPLAFVSLLALIVATVAALYYRSRYRLAAYGFLAMLLCLAPTSSFLPIADPFAEHRMYLPMFAVILIILEALIRWRTERGTLFATTAIALVILGFLTFQRAAVWGNEIALWGDSAEKSSSKVRPRFQLAFSHYKVGQCAEAVREFQKASILAPPTFDLDHDWAEAEDCVGNEAQALKLFQQAEQKNPSGLVSSQIGMVLAKQGHYPEALAALATAEAQDPTLAAIFSYRGNIYYAQGEYAKAVDQFQRALSIDPANGMALQGLPLAKEKLAIAHP